MRLVLIRRAVLLACSAGLVAACGSQNTQGPNPTPWKNDPALAPASLSQSHEASAGSSPVQGGGSQGSLASPVAAGVSTAQSATTPEPDIPPAQLDGLEESDGDGRASAAPRGSCELPNCGVVLSISGKERWQIEVQMHDGSVQVFEQDYQPAFQIGDPVLVDGAAVFLWN